MDKLKGINDRKKITKHETLDNMHANNEENRQN
jgi:hypothetical protein